MPPVADKINVKSKRGPSPYLKKKINASLRQLRDVWVFIYVRMPIGYTVQYHKYLYLDKFLYTIFAFIEFYLKIKNIGVLQ